MNPNCSESYFYKGYLLSLKKDLKGAIDNYSRAISIDIDFVDAYVNRGYIYKIRKQKTEALADFKKAIRLFHLESMQDEIENLEKEVKSLEREIENVPWWQTKIF
jgi:tetratricopeptide (TPR) repeat protein